VRLCREVGARATSDKDGKLHLQSKAKSVGKAP
jgi:hypothetical protein